MIGVMKKVLVKLECEVLVVFEMIVGGKCGGKRKMDAASADADAASRTSGGKWCV